MPVSFSRTSRTIAIDAMFRLGERIQLLFHAITNARSRGKNDHVKKHHWCLGFLGILVGSWITHTTTATIEVYPSTIESPQALGFSSHLNASNLVPINFSPAVFSATRPSTTENYSDENIYKANVDTTIEFDNSKLIDSSETLTTRTHKIRKGESLGSIFKKRKYDLAIPENISQHEVASTLVALSIGRNLTFELDQDEQLQQLRYPVGTLQELVVKLDGVNIESAEVIDLPYRTAQYRISGEIETSLYQSALDAGLSVNLIMDLVTIFGWDIDFVQDLRSGDDFHVVYEDYMLDDAKLADGHILAAEFTTQGQTHRAIRFADKEGVHSYYTPEGDSMLGTFLRSPVKFSRISSRFGKRKHPISKKWKAHKGVDYAASRGTPIRATADGKIIHAGRKGGYGKTIIVRHAGRFTTLYAHMNGFAKGIRSGQRVKQGDTIGYVGTTGYSTGPHLHYEFRFDGIHRNPLTYKTPKASSVSSESKNRFLKVANNWQRELNKLQKYHLLAKIAARNAKL